MTRGSMLRRGAVVLLVLFWIGMFIGTHVPAVVLPPVDVSDKLLHLAAYACLGFLFALATLPVGMTPRRAAGLWLVLAAYGVCDELLQIPVNRRADFLDWVADILGAACGLLLYSLAAWAFQRLVRRLAPE